jgi:ATP-dependent Clp protease ATP-binding subunit ClpA
LTKAAYERKLKEVFAPEFRGRIDEIVVFNHLGVEECSRILDLELGKVCKRLANKGISLKVTQAAKTALISEAISPELGVRKLAQYVREQVTKPLSRLIVNTGSVKFVCRHEKGQFVVEPAAGGIMRPVPEKEDPMAKAEI